MGPRSAVAPRGGPDLAPKVLLLLAVARALGLSVFGCFAFELNPCEDVELRLSVEASSRDRLLTFKNCPKHIKTKFFIYSF